MVTASAANPAVTGKVSRGMLRTRAVELAGLDGRAPQDASKSDWEQAKKEWMPNTETQEQDEAAAIPHQMEVGSGIVQRLIEEAVPDAPFR